MNRENLASWRRGLRHGASLCALLAAAGAAAQAPVDTSAPAGAPLSLASPLAAPAPANTTGPVATAARTGRTHDLLGLQLDLGAPDLAGVSLLYRPLKWLRFEGGMLYNYVGYGVRGGVSVAPHYWIAPSLTLEAGHYFETNAYAKISQHATVDDNVRPLLEKVGYSFVNGQVGLELGHPNGFVFFVRGGLTRLWLHDSARGASFEAGGGTWTVKQDLAARFGIPSAKLGFMIFFW